MPERTLDPVRLTAMRVARSALLEAAGRDDPSAVEAAVVRFVRAMWAADFTRQTIRTLVGAALDAALPTGRGAVQRARRAAAIATWSARADAIADAIADAVAGIPRGRRGHGR